MESFKRLSNGMPLKLTLANFSDSFKFYYSEVKNKTLNVLIMACTTCLQKQFFVIFIQVKFRSLLNYRNLGLNLFTLKPVSVSFSQCYTFYSIGVKHLNNACFVVLFMLPL